MKIIVDEDVLTKQAKNIQVQVEKIVNVDFKKMQKCLETIDGAWEGSGKETIMNQLTNYLTELQNWMAIVQKYPTYIQEYLKGGQYVDMCYSNINHETK